jgi:hypothetical protein
MVVMASDWPLLTGGRYSEVVVSTGLTVFWKDYYAGISHILVLTFSFSGSFQFASKIYFDFSRSQ